MFRKKNGKHQKKIVPKFCSTQLDLVRGRDYSLLWNKEHTERVFSLNTLKGRIKVPFRSDAMKWAFADGAKMGTAKLVFRKGKFYLHIPVTVEVPDPPEPSEITNVVGIDRGIRFLTVSFDGEKTSFVSGAEVKQKRAHYKKLRQSLQKKQTSSARRRIRAIGRRENRWMNDVNHCLSTTLVRDNPEGTLFVLEDLTGIRSATERVRVKDRYVQVSWPYYDLEQKLTYKAQMNGSAVIKVDPRYTSQTCPVCGHREKNNRDHGKHVFSCR
ncbi:MAG: transposase, partial [Oscillospiraceae bacterium]|nr:transposase [Oscillospiraceae bacterium]